MQLSITSLHNQFGGGGDWEYGVVVEVDVRVSGLKIKDWKVGKHGVVEMG